MAQRHMAVSCVRPDEIAECWDGVLAVNGLYEALWAFVERYEEPRPEVSEEPIIGGRDSIERFWDELSEEHQVALNCLVTKQFWYDGEE